MEETKIVRTEENKKQKSKAIILKGVQGKEIIFRNNMVKIIKDGFLFTSKRERTFRIRNILSAEVRKPGLFMKGFICFSIIGRGALKSTFKVDGKTCKKEYLYFKDNESYRKALKIKRCIENHLELDPNKNSNSNVLEISELIKFKELLDLGILTNEEFNSKKRQLLNI